MRRNQGSHLNVRTENSLFTGSLYDYMNSFSVIDQPFDTKLKWFVFQFDFVWLFFLLQSSVVSVTTLTTKENSDMQRFVSDVKYTSNEAF